MKLRLSRKCFYEIRNEIFSKSRTTDRGIDFTVSYIVRTTDIPMLLILYSLK